MTPRATGRTEATIARRSIGALLAASRDVLLRWPREADRERRAQLVDDFLARAAAIVDGTLRRNRRLNEAPLPALLRRLRERVTAIGALISPASDTFHRLLLLEAGIDALAGEPDAAMRCVTRAVSRIHLIQDYLLRDAVLFRFIDLALALGRLEEAAAACVRDLIERRQARTLGLAWFDRLAAIAARADSLHDPALRRAARMLRPATRIAALRPRSISLMLASAYLQRLGRARMRRAMRSARRDPGAPPLAIRAMGGAGDILTMTPALRVLARRGGQKIDMLLPRRFAPLLENNPDVRLHFIEQLDDDWRPPLSVIDLTDCPTVVGELAEMPNIVTDRIVLFARGMGVTEAELDRVGRRPIFEPPQAAEAAAERWLQGNGLDGERFVAVQARAAESYKSWPGIAAAAIALASFVPVVVFDETGLAGFDDPRIRTAFGLELGTAFAIACRAAVIVSADSALLHLAGARAIPSVGIFGPTSGAARVAAYPEAMVVDQSERFRCIACWRNEFTECRVTQGMRSACLDTLPVDKVVEAVRAALARLS